MRSGRPEGGCGLGRSHARWPARFARQTGVPIIPGYTREVDGLVEIEMAPAIREDDIGRATQAWASAFERMILAEPWEWAFLVDLRWARHLKAAAAEGWGTRH